MLRRKSLDFVCAPGPMGLVDIGGAVFAGRLVGECGTTGAGSDCLGSCTVWGGCFSFILSI